MYKVLIENGSGRILGAHLLGPEADEFANVFALAIRADIRADALRETLFVYPTQSLEHRVHGVAPISGCGR